MRTRKNPFTQLFYNVNTSEKCKKKTIFLDPLERDPPWMINFLETYWIDARNVQYLNIHDRESWIEN